MVLLAYIQRGVMGAPGGTGTGTDVCVLVLVQCAYRQRGVVGAPGWYWYWCVCSSAGTVCLQPARGRGGPGWPTARSPAPPSPGSWRSSATSPRQPPPAAAGPDEPPPSLSPSGGADHKYIIYIYIRQTTANQRAACLLLPVKAATIVCVCAVCVCVCVCVCV